MKTRPACLLLLSTFVLVSLAAAAKSHEEAVFIFENRKVTLAVPHGFGIATQKDEQGLMNVQIADEKQHVTAHIVFIEDPDSRFGSVQARQDKMVDLFDNYVAQSTEKAMQFEELKPVRGAGTFCVFTDSALVGKAKLPPGEYLHFTTGLKAWPGVVAIFRVLSNDTSSDDYKAVMTMLRESVDERPVPLK